MEGLNFDYDDHKESDSDDKPEVKDKKDKPVSIFSELLKEKPETKEQPKERQPELEREKSEDKAPELDAEAPYNHLAEEERGAATKVYAEDRLEEVKKESPEVNSETVYAISLLENVIANPDDMDEAQDQTLTEMGVTEAELATINLNPESVETEAVEPIDSDTLRAARQELRVETVPQPPQTEAMTEPEPTPSVKSTRSNEWVPASKKSKRLHEGLVDYVVGRRVGRKTEKSDEEHLENQLDNELKSIRQEIARKEEYVRKIARDREQDKTVSEASLTEEVIPIQPIKQPETAQPVMTKEDEPVAKIESLAPTLLTPETEVSLQRSEQPKEPKKERLEQPQEDKTVEQKEKDSKPALKAELAGFSAHTMKRRELVEVSKRVKFEGTSLFQLYTSHLVGEKGLRRVIAEYLRGGDYSRTLQLELLEKEKDFERDPKLRDQASSMPISSANTQLDSLLKRSGIEWDESSQTPLPTKTKSSNVSNLLSDIKSPASPVRLVADIVMVILILAMAAVITYLLISRSR